MREPLVWMRSWEGWLRIPILSLDTTVIAISHRYYRGISERYDYVLEIKDKRIDVYEANKYFMEVAI